MIAMTRMMDKVDIPNGPSFNPKTTEITPQNIQKLFSHAFASLDKSQSDAFDALTRYLQSNKATA